MTASHKAFGSLWYGDVKPTLILSTEAVMMRTLRILMPSARKPAMYGGNTGFMLNGAIWSHDGEVEEGVVYVLNQNFILDSKLNGFYRPNMEGK